MFTHSVENGDPGVLWKFGFSTLELLWWPIGFEKAEPLHQLLSAASRFFWDVSGW